MTRSPSSRSEKKPAPSPLLRAGVPLDWWFIFKFNAAEEPEPSLPTGSDGIFDKSGWKDPGYETRPRKHSQHFVGASSETPELRHMKGYLGTSREDPLGATFAQVYDGDTFYVLWNDQFYDDPHATLLEPWGHSKGLLAWNEDGEGFVLQVSTPSWPASGNHRFPRRTDGNTLGYIRDDDVEVSQHFFATRLTKDDLLMVLRALKNADVVTGVSTAKEWNGRSRVKESGRPLDPPLPEPLPSPPDPRQVVNNGGPKAVQAAVNRLLDPPEDDEKERQACLVQTLSNGMKLVSKNARYAVPPWQLVSAVLGGVDLRVASWWAEPGIFSTTREHATPGCWHPDLGTPGAVEIALTGDWKGPERTEPLGFRGIPSPDGNHAKVGVSTGDGVNLAVFGDMNQMGAWCPDGYEPGQTCDMHQNGRGGLFYAVENADLCHSVRRLLKGESVPLDSPARRKKGGWSAAGKGEPNEG
ncbi:MAG: deoxyribonuclease II family protein [Xanthomonadales bacterium]|jgi:hypothetical protein|nr:deoxyribonuclease II family protein [Xanthomonadales bacterium]